jgi:hypothetical protein
LTPKQNETIIFVAQDSIIREQLVDKKSGLRLSNPGTDFFDAVHQE